MAQAAEGGLTHRAVGGCSTWEGSRGGHGGTSEPGARRRGAVYEAARGRERMLQDEWRNGYSESS